MILGTNNWHCDGQLSWLIKLLQARPPKVSPKSVSGSGSYRVKIVNHPIFISKDSVCKTPIALKGLSLGSLDLESIESSGPLHERGRL